MNKFYVDLGEKICTLYTTGRNIVSYEEFDYPSNLKTLDLLYSKMKGVQIDEGIVVLHGVVSMDHSGMLTLGSASVAESQDDMQKLQHLFRALGITKIAFFDYLGFYLFNAAGKNMFVSQKLQSLDIVVADNTNIITAENCSFNSFLSTAQILKNRYELESIINVDAYVSPALTKYFLNVDAVDDAEDMDSFLHEISLFAFTMTTNSENYKVTVDISTMQGAGLAVPERQPANIAAGNVQAESTYSNMEGFSSVGMQGQPALLNGNDTKSRKGKNARKVKNSAGNLNGDTVSTGQLSLDTRDSAELPKQKRKKFGLPFRFSMFICLLTLVAAAIFKIGSREIKSLEEKEREMFYGINNQLDVHTAQLSAYKRLEDSGADTDSLTVLGSIDASRLGRETKLSVQKSDIVVNTLYKSKEDAEAFVQYLKKSYSVGPSEIVKADKQWSCKAAIKVI